MLQSFLQITYAWVACHHASWYVQYAPKLARRNRIQKVLAVVNYTDKDWLVSVAGKDVVSPSEGFGRRPRG
jgi:hypothetical protein